MKNLYFKSKGRYELIVIEFESYYGRMWEEPVGVFWYDLGSHTSFFVICDEDYIDDFHDERKEII